MASTSLIAQFQIHGKVTDKEGKAIENAELLLQGKNQQSRTNAAGWYEIRKLEKGSYLLRCQAIGYELEDRKIELTKDMEINFSLQEEKLEIEEVFVQATRANENTATTYNSIKKEELQRMNFGQDLPYLLQMTPSAVVTSDAGAGVGYTGLRIRGVDPTRTNLTINGIPINDAESHSIYWVNMPDLANSVDNIQIQRGVGTSTNGSAAFGASINVQTDQIRKRAYAELDQSYGSFNTYKSSVKVGTGLLKKGFAFDMRLSNIQSDGYIDRATSNLKSYFFSGSYLNKKHLLRFNTFSGKEVTYQSWYGTPESVLYGNEADRIAYADRNYLTDAQRDNLLRSGRTYNFYEYDNEVDNYQQTHYQLMHTYSFHKRFKLNTGLHYTKGKGYFEQYQQGEDFADYNLTPIILGTDTISTTDLIRRRWLDNDFYGLVMSLDYKSIKGFRMILGGAYNQYDGRHFGEIIWARSASDSEIRDTYYDNFATKKDGNVYGKFTYRKNKFVSFLDLQYRFIDYSFLGIDQVNGAFVNREQSAQFNFFNPKLGFTYHFNPRHYSYVSYAIGNREPIRGDFRSYTPGNRPSHETLYNLEAGYHFTGSRLRISSNFYFMDYNNQLILTGKINDVGDYTRINVKDSYRSGIELQASMRLRSKFDIGGNLTISQNKIPSFTEYVDNSDINGQTTIEHQNTDLAFSPNVIAGIQLGAEWFPGFRTTILSKYVGAQYLDNTSSSDRKIEAYYVTHLQLSYTTKRLLGDEMTFGFLLNNVFNQLYSSNGYTWGYIYGGVRTIENFYYPQAGINYLGRIQIKF